MKRRHKVGIAALGVGLSPFLVLGIIRLFTGNGLIWHFLPWHLAGIR